MSDLKPLTIDEEFRLFTGVVMNNWFALKVMINESNNPVSSINLKINGLLDLLISSAQSVINQLCEWTEPADAIEDYFDFHFNTYVEDDSCEEVLIELVNYYKILVDNDREALSQALRHLSDKRHIFTQEEYDPGKVVRVATQTTLNQVSPNASVKNETHQTPLQLQASNISVNNELNFNCNAGNGSGTAIGPGISDCVSQPFEQPRDGWETVQTRRKKKN